MEDKTKMEDKEKKEEIKLSPADEIIFNLVNSFSNAFTVELQVKPTKENKIEIKLLRTEALQDEFIK